MHLGKNIAQLRHHLGIKQEDLANRLQTTQQNLSKIEAKENISDTLLSKIAEALEIPVDIIKKYDGQKIINNVSQEGGNNVVVNYVETYNFNGLDEKTLDKLLGLLTKIVQK
jgi:transcriptional regulator with XRE-family HTH domain